ncbi:MAG: protein kinase [Acidobacteria bacterium]|nr:protein kinase [Acidobacteriota bacterium]
MTPVSPDDTTIGVTRPDALPAPSADILAFFEGWDRYRVQEKVGEGGMGIVYKALDTKLNRWVALKFIRSALPELESRLVVEAKAQARIENEHICKVYEVSEFRGTPYIAMQFLNGDNIKKIAPSMNLEEKVLLIREVAESLHEAHRIGIIHRDIKPANIMVERLQNGRYFSHLTDFGLARDLNSHSDVTESDKVLGTPAYLAPEQVLGEMGRVDRRCDIYSLGATLYEMVTGSSLFSGNYIHVLNQVVHDDPPPAKAKVPNLPQDLNTIIMKCLDKDPNHRYGTAQALADDLQRYLNGDPIEAQQSSWSYRMVKRVKKHRLAFGLGGLAVVLGLLLVVNYWQAERKTSETARWTQAFSTEAERLETFMDRVHLLPPHNLGPELKYVQDQLSGLEAQMKVGGSLSQGPGFHALARGYIALQNYPAAYEAIQKAERSPTQAPNLMLTKGMILAQLFREGLEAATAIPSAELRQKRIRELEQQYRDPAVNALQSIADQNNNPWENPHFTLALIESIQKNYQKALDLLEATPTNLSPQNLKLKADILADMAEDLAQSGHQDAAFQSYKEAESYYREAQNIARSDPAILIGLADLHIRVLDQQYRYGLTPGDTFQQLDQVCGEMETLLPLAVYGPLYRASGAWRHARYQDRSGENPWETLNAAIQNAEQAVQRAAAHAQPMARERAWEVLCNALQRKGDYESRHGFDPINSYNLAAVAVEESLKINPNSIQNLTTQASLYSSLALAKRNKGQDPLPDLEASLKIYERILRTAPQFTTAFNNLGVNYLEKAWNQWQVGLDPQPALRAAETNYQKALNLNPQLNRALTGLGMAAHYRGMAKLYAGEDPTADLAQAATQFEKAFDLNPNHGFSLNNWSYSLETRIRYALLNQEDPMPFLSKARALLESSAKIDTSDGFLFAGQAMLDVLEGTSKRIQHQSAENEFGLAHQRLTKAVQINPLNDFFFTAQAETDLEWSLNRRDLGKDPQILLDRGISEAEKAISLNPRNVKAPLILANLVRLKAEYVPKNQQSEWLNRSQFLKEKTPSPYQSWADQMWQIPNL